MKILVIGGTMFVGRHFVEEALSKGHELTILHRGKSPIPAQWKVSEILTDRDGGLDALDGKSWDAVVDCCGYVPRIVKASAEKLKDKVETYLFISTVSVYRAAADGGLEVDRRVNPIGTEEITWETYGPLKVECENEVDAVYGSRAVHIRPGIVAGAFDPTNRFTYWVERFLKYDAVLTPRLDDCPGSLVDARDLAEFTLKMLEEKRSGAHNATGPIKTFGEMIQTCIEAGKVGKPLYADEKFFEENEVKLGSELPLVREKSKWAGPIYGAKSTDSLKLGLKNRPLIETAEAVVAWIQSPEYKAASTNRSGATLSREREEQLLALLRK